MITATIFGILASVFGEVITAINKKLSGTVVAGDASFLMVLAISFVGAVIKEIITPGFTWSMFTDWQSLGQTFGTIFAASQVYFYFVTQKLNLDVTASTKPATPSI